mgnify:CR=1 FL=1
MLKVLIIVHIICYARYMEGTHTGKGAKMRRTLNKTRLLAGKTDPDNTSLWLPLWMHLWAGPAMAPGKRKTGHGL